MSLFAPSRIPEAERVRRSQALFETHRLRQLRTYYPEESLFDASTSETIDCWSDPPILLNKLYDLLPFGQVTYSWDFDTFRNIDLARIAEVAQEQLLYWHLADSTTVHNLPCESLLLWNKDDYFWFLHVSLNKEEITRRILEGEHIRYLEKFSLNYDQIQVTFQELRLVTQGSDHILAITEGIEFTYKWDSTSWEVTLENPDQSLVDPRIYHLPPDAPTDPEILEFAAARLPTNPSSLPPSSPPSLIGDSVSGWGDPPNPWINRQSCWCEKEVCTCGYRPDTPPTPPSVVLWAPGSLYLPFRE